MFGISRISISWDFRSVSVLKAIKAVFSGRIGFSRRASLETLPEYLRRDVGLLPRQGDLPDRDPRW